MITIVLGTSGGPGSERAAAWATELRRLLHGDLEVIAAYARRSAEESPAVVRQLHERSADDLEHWADTQHLGTASLHTMERTPDEAITSTANQVGADLVIIGSEEEEGATSLGLGSVAHRLAHHLDCPLIVVPPGDTTIAGRTIVVGVDGEMSSCLALGWASRLGEAIRGRVVAVCSVDALDQHTASPGNDDSIGAAAAEEVRAAGGDIKLIERYGVDPASTLRAVSAELDAALIVVSARRRHSLGGLLLGSVADHLLHRPTRPVAVLPHGYDGSS